VSAIFAFILVLATGRTQTLTIYEQAKAAFTSNSTISNVVLDGTFVSVEGSLKQDGLVHLVAGNDGTYSVSLTRNSGAAGEARTHPDSGATCTWKDHAGKDHPVSSFNCHTPAWFLPELPVLLSSKANSEWLQSTQQTDESIPHLKFDYNISAEEGQNSQPELAIDIELSSATLLPTRASFYIHPDRQSSINIPVEVTYQNYRSVSGVSIPFRIQKFVNGTLVLDITISSANVN
jgi:hypothetical protein